MIYFKVSSVIEESDNTSLSSILLTIKHNTIVKIGYTDDNSETIRSRDSVYRTENPSIIHYKYISGGTREDEKGIHEYLKDYRYAGREWFNLTPEVVDFIENVNTIEDIRDLLGDIIEKFRDVEDKLVVINEIAPIVISTTHLVDSYNDYFVKLEEMSEKLRSLVNYSESYEKDLLMEIERLYPDHYTSIITTLDSYRISKNDLDPLLKEYYTLPTFPERLRFISKFIRKHPNYEKILVNCIVPYFKTYIEKIGLPKIATLGYRKVNLDRELSNRRFENNEKENLLEKVYETFKVNGRYSRVSIKSTLNQIYESLGIIPSNKIQATDIEKYFEVERTRLVNSITKKRDEGFRLLKKKI